MNVAANSQTKVFISYRREDTKAISRLIYETLRRRFGERQIFFDIDSIPPGEDFVDYLGQQVAQCNVMLAVIGDRWLSSGKIFHADDFVHVELRAALERGIPIMPIFADGAKVPQLEDVPESLHPLLRRHGLPVDSGRDFDNHMEAVARNAERLATQYLTSRAAEEQRLAREREREQQRAREAAERRLAAERSRQRVSAPMNTTSDDTNGPAPARSRFRVVERLGHDGLMELFRAETVGLSGFQKTVLIRRLLPHLAERRRFVGLLLDEARLAGNLSHANIHSIIDVGVGDNTYFCVYDYLDFETLKEIMGHARRRFDVSLACYICREVCRALEYAHTATHVGKPLGIIHRDLSPPNVYLVADGRVVLGGFGLAKAATQLEESEPGIIKGKFSYLSPEAVSGEFVSQRSDLFCLGIILWELVAGRRLFFGETDMETVKLVKTATWIPLSTVVPNYGGELDPVLRQLLAKDPNARFPSARAARQALDNVLRQTGAYVGQDEIAELVREYRASRQERQAAASPKRGSIISSLIDEALLEFTSLDDASSSLAKDRGESSEQASSPAQRPFPETPESPGMLEPGELAGLEDDDLSWLKPRAAPPISVAHRSTNLPRQLLIAFVAVLSFVSFVYVAGR
jgi:serine/threonine-protein kinase